MRKIWIVLLFLAVSVVSMFVCAQTATTYRAETFGSLASGEHTPFWITNQNWGVVSLASDNFYLRGGVFHSRQLNNDWRFEAGIDMVGGNDSPYGNVWVQQFYGRLDWKIWRLDLGSREDYASILNPRLSSGDFVQSNNARPIPEIKLSIPDFLLVPYTKGNFFLKGDFAVGKQLDNRWLKEQARPDLQNYTQDNLTHHKSIYFRFGDMQAKHRMQFTVGLMHYAQWGAEILKYKKNEAGEWGYISKKETVGLDDFFRIVIAKENPADAASAYVAGSQWGAYHLRYDYRLPSREVLSAYAQHFFDDGSGMTFENYRDNLLGIEYQSGKKDWLSGAVFEYVYTKQQTGPIHHNILMDEDHKHLQNKGNGNDNYYNNMDYIQGPSYYGKSLGTPLLLSPEYNNDGSLNFKSNRIIAFHLGIEGYLTSSLQYRLMLSTGQSWGRYYHPFTEVKKGFASLLEISYEIPVIRNLKAKFQLGYDDGAFFGGDTFGCSIGIIKQGILFSR